MTNSVLFEVNYHHFSLDVTREEASKHLNIPESELFDYCVSYFRARISDEANTKWLWLPRNSEQRRQIVTTLARRNGWQLLSVDSGIEEGSR